MLRNSYRMFNQGSRVLHSQSRRFHSAPPLFKEKIIEGIGAYFGFTVLTTVVGTIIGAGTGAVLSPLMDKKNFPLEKKEAKTMLGKFANDVDDGLTIFFVSTLVGAILGAMTGSLPITYPLAKLYEFSYGDSVKKEKGLTSNEANEKHQQVHDHKNHLKS